MTAKSKRPTRRSARIPESHDVSMPPGRYQPSKVEHKEEVDMPDISKRHFRVTLFSPFHIIKCS